MKILLTGANGQLGSELARRLPALGELTAADRAALDLAKVEAIRRALREAKPQLVVNCAAYTAVDRAESEPTLAHAVNAVAPAVLAEEARRLGALLVHYSTDYVFDGEKGAPYVEEDPCNPLNVYGRTKLAGEEAVRGSGCRHLVLRASWVYAPRGRNFVRAILRKARAGEPLRVVDDQTGVPTSAAFLAEATMRALAAGGEGLITSPPPARPPGTALPARSSSASGSRSPSRPSAPRTTLRLRGARAIRCSMRRARAAPSAFRPTTGARFSSG